MRSMMRKLYCRRGAVLLIIATLVLTFSASSAAAAPDLPVNLPACGSDPSANTLAWQQAINNAAPGTTLVLPSGTCVVAKCDNIAKGAVCYGGAGLPHKSALHIGKYQALVSNLTLAGAADGTSVLKLDPNPQPSNGYHGYCGDTHVLSIHGASFITLRDFTIDGSDGELPEDTNQCPGNGGKIDEHMDDVLVVNSTDITIDRMKLIKAHGDGLNLIANLDDLGTNITHTERISVTNTDFLANDRAGLTFQRNVGYVTVRSNYFRGSGEDQDLDMEPSGGPADLGPYEVDIDHNLFERTTPKKTVSLGSAGGAQPSNGVRFTNNTIGPGPKGGEGGCIAVYKADNTTIANNTVIGGRGCVTLAAEKVTGLRVENNYLEGYANLYDDGYFVPGPVIRISERVVIQGDTKLCGDPPKKPCPYSIHYPDRITITGNTVVQQVQYSPGVELSNADALVIADNQISHTHKVAPSSPLNPNYPVPRPGAINLPFGVQNLRSYGYYLNEKTEFNVWSITGNKLSQFADGIRVAPIKAGVALASAVINSNVFNTAHNEPRGIWLVGTTSAPASGFINSLTMNGNQFGCGFADFLTKPGSRPPLHAYVGPSGQAFTGNIGFTVACP